MWPTCSTTYIYITPHIYTCTCARSMLHACTQHAARMHTACCTHAHSMLMRPACPILSTRGSEGHGSGRADYHHADHHGVLDETRRRHCSRFHAGRGACRPHALAVGIRGSCRSAHLCAGMRMPWVMPWVHAHMHMHPASVARASQCVLTCVCSRIHIAYTGHRAQGVLTH